MKVAMIRAFRDDRERLVGDGMDWYYLLGHKLYTALMMSGELVVVPAGKIVMNV